MTRWKAATIRLSVTALIGVIVAALMFTLWYPSPFFLAAGADGLILMVVSVDLTLGPLLTLILFRPGKRGLKFDMILIGVVQTAALIFGLFIVLQSRPVFIVGVLDRFVLVSANEITDADLTKGGEPDFRSRSWTGPRLVATQMPTDEHEQSELAFAALQGRDVQNQPKYYRAYALAGKTLLAKARPLEALRRKIPQFESIIADWLVKSGRAEDSVVWLPLQARKEDMVMLLDADTAQPLKALPIDPW